MWKFLGRKKSKSKFFFYQSTKKFSSLKLWVLLTKTKYIFPLEIFHLIDLFGASVFVCICMYGPAQSMQLHSFIYPCNWLIVGRVFANGLEDLGSILGRIIPKTLKMVLDTSLLNTQQYKVHIKGKVEPFRERSSALPYTLV